MTREFYEFVLPPVDVRVGPSGTTIAIDVPGFKMSDIRLSLSGDLLTIRAEKQGEGGPEEGEGEAGSLQRPRRLDKTVRLPAGAASGGAGMCTAGYADGVLTVVIPTAGGAGGKEGGGDNGAGPPGPAA